MPQEESNQPEGIVSREQIRLEIARIAQEICDNDVRFSFPGLLQESYAQIKEDQESPWASPFETPIDILLERFRNEGMRLTLGKNPQNKNVFILPGTDAITDDTIMANSILPRHLKITEDMNPRLTRLIQLEQADRRL